LVSASCQQLLLAIFSRQWPSRYHFLSNTRHGHQVQASSTGTDSILIVFMSLMTALSFLTLFLITANTYYNITSPRLPNTPAQYHLQQADNANIYVSTTFEQLSTTTTDRILTAISTYALLHYLHLEHWSNSARHLYFSQSPHD